MAPVPEIVALFVCVVFRIFLKYDGNDDNNIYNNNDFNEGIHRKNNDYNNNKTCS